MALSSPPEIYERLMANRTDIKVGPEMAQEIWFMFRTKLPSDKNVFRQIEVQAFMQACLMAAMDASSAMGWVQALFSQAYKPNATVVSLMKALAKHAFKQYYKQLRGQPRDLYRTVLVTIAWSQKSTFEAIAMGDPSLML